MFLCKVFSVYFVLISFSNAVLETKPKSTVSLKGKRVEFKCRTGKSSDSQNPIDWGFASYGRTTYLQFYHNGQLHLNYSKRYEVLTNETGQCDLIIDSVDFSHAGNYRCTSKPSGIKTKSYSAAELIVLDSNPICKANSLNDTEEYETTVTECHLNYRGNAKPRMECTANDDRAIINGTMTVNNYTDSTYRDNITLTYITSSVMTSSFTISKLKNTAITCNITFILINNSSNTDDNFEYFHLWTYYAPKHRSKDNEEGKGNEDTAEGSPPNIMITVACVLGTACFIIVLLLLLCKKFCGRQNKRVSRNSEPDVLLPMQSTQYEEVQLQDRPGIATGAPASAFDVQGEDVSCESEIDEEDGKVKLESGKKKSASYSVVSKKRTSSKAKKKNVVTGADGTVYTEVSVRPDCGKPVQPSRGPRPAVHRVQNYVPVDHTWKCPPPPPKI